MVRANLSGSFASVLMLGVLLNVASCQRIGAQPASEDGAPALTAGVQVAQANELPVQPMAQVGPWTPTPANTEEPFINIVHASAVSWTEHDETNTQELYDIGLIDPETGFPNRIRNNWLRSRVFFSTWPDPSHWAGDWVLEWETEDSTKADVSLHWYSDDRQRRVGRNRIEFRRTAKDYHSAIAIRRLKSPLTALSNLQEGKRSSAPRRQNF